MTDIKIHIPLAGVQNYVVEYNIRPVTRYELVRVFSYETVTDAGDAEFTGGSARLGIYESEKAADEMRKVVSAAEMAKVAK